MSAPDGAVRRARLEELEAQFDPEMQFRPLGAAAGHLVGGLLVVLSCFHYYTAGFGILRETTHRGIHLAFVLGLVFLVFGLRRQRAVAPSTWWRPGGVPLYDWICAFTIAASALYLPLTFDDLAFRVGNPNPLDLVMGSAMILLVLETARRSMGPALPLIATGFMLYAIWGRHFPGVLVHPGATWSNLVNHLYLTSQGIYGIAVGVVATFVFHFVLFGVLATRIGLGQLFIDLAGCVAGRQAGGAAKVSICSSALFGMISGSSIANTVTTGTMTIPAMIRTGYPRHVAAAIESTSSTGGQITPPIMGAAAFMMIEFLEMPYRDIMIAAILPAAMHYLGIYAMVHLEAKKRGIRGLSEAELPRLRDVLKGRWHTVIPLVALLAILLQGYTPFMAAFWGITACIVVGFLQPRDRLRIGDLIDAFRTGAKYALAVGAAAAAVGIIVGVVTLTGVGFKLSFMVTSSAAQFAGALMPFVPFELFGQRDATLFLTLVLTAFACIVMGAGIPTTPTYIILVTVAAPALGLLGVAPIVAHFFVFYYGVLADITPPVALAAFAGAGIAGANPFQTGNKAFQLATAKALVPFVFVYSPSLLLVTKDFSLEDLAITLAGCILGIFCLAGAMIGYFKRPMATWERLLAFAAALLLIAPGIKTGLVGIVLIAPVLVAQYARRGPA